MAPSYQAAEDLRCRTSSHDVLRVTAGYSGRCGAGADKIIEPMKRKGITFAMHEARQ